MAALSRDVAASAWRRESLPSGVLPVGHALLLLSALRSGCPWLGA